MVNASARDYNPHSLDCFLHLLDFLQQVKCHMPVPVCQLQCLCQCQCSLPVPLPPDFFWKSLKFFEVLRPVSNSATQAMARWHEHWHWQWLPLRSQQICKSSTEVKRHWHWALSIGGPCLLLVAGGLLSHARRSEDVGG